MNPTLCRQLRTHGLGFLARQNGCPQVELRSLDIDEISGVDTPANDLPGWIVMKAKGSRAWLNPDYHRLICEPEGECSCQDFWDATVGQPEAIGAVADDDMQKAVPYRHNIYSGAEQEPPNLANPDDGSQLAEYNPVGIRADTSDLPPALQAEGIEDTRRNQNDPAQAPSVLEGDFSNLAVDFNHYRQEANHGLQQAYPGDGRDYTRPVVPADPKGMIEGIDLTSPNYLSALQQRYGSDLLKLPRHIASAGAVNPQYHPRVRAAMRRRANLGR